jgi:rhodanese-related sulfurtransferase
VGNFDEDEYAEIVFVSNGKVYLFDHDGTTKWGPVSIPGGGKGGAPTVADFNNDKKVEIGIAGATKYSVFTGTGDVLWSSTTQDASSNATGSSVYDFEGDGAYEVVYSDEVNLRIYNGSNGKVLYEIPVGSVTGYEYPVIADVDNDGNAEIVAVANNNCGYGKQSGLFVIGDANDTWVNTRKIWNQHAYSITNVNNDGTIPAIPDTNWLIFNNFRCNQSVDARACVDITASFLRIKEGKAEVRVGNAGALITPKYIKVAFYRGESSAKELLGTVIIDKQLEPGEYIDIELTLNDGFSGNQTVYSVVDDDGTGCGMVREINEANNTVYAVHDFSARKIRNVSAQEAYEIIKGNDIVIIDVRTGEEYSTEHLMNAVNIDVNSSGFRGRLELLDKTKKYMIYCASGSRSGIAAEIFAELGFENVYAVEGGIAAWKAAGYEVVK